jgi:hypothetical protein
MSRCCIALLSMLVFGCGSITGPQPIGVAFRPPSTYATWWAAVELCSGRRGDVARIQWHESPDGALGSQSMGQWRPDHEVYLVHFVVTHQLRHTVQHEMLHDLLSGDPDHLSPLWARCGL